MRRICTTILCLCLGFMFLIGCGGKSPQQETARYLTDTVGKAQSGFPGGEWTVIALERSGHLPAGWREAYFAALKARLSQCDGELSQTKSTEYSRAALAVRVLGGDPQDVGGYNLFAQLENIEIAEAQGVSAMAYALLALAGEGDEALCADYAERLLKYQLSCGGFSPDGDEADADITAICLQALVRIEGAKEAVQAALAALSAMQNADGSFSSGGAANAESTAQAVIALCELGIAPDSDPRFVKDKSALNALLSFRVSGGGFTHIAGGNENLIASEQALCALAAAARLENGGSGIFDFTGGKALCAISVRCDELLENMDKLPAEKHALVPADGLIYENTSAEFAEGESAFNVLKRELMKEGIHFEFVTTPVTGIIYIEGIANLYEFDCGQLSGWFYSVNGKNPPMASSEYILEDGDTVVFEFACTMREVSQ